MLGGNRKLLVLLGEGEEGHFWLAEQGAYSASSGSPSGLCTDLYLAASSVFPGTGEGGGGGWGRDDGKGTSAWGQLEAGSRKQV